MIYLKKYKPFLEDFEVNDTDEEDVKLSKEKLNDVKDQISYYKTNKSKVDSLFKDPPENISDELDKIITKDDKRNPFLVSYSSIARMQKKVDDLKERETKKNIELDELNDRLSDASDDIKKDIQDRISDVREQISNIKRDISESSRKIPEIEKEHKEKMDKKEQDIKDWISKIN